MNWRTLLCVFFLSLASAHSILAQPQPQQNAAFFDADDLFDDEEDELELTRFQAFKQDASDYYKMLKIYLRKKRDDFRRQKLVKYIKEQMLSDVLGYLSDKRVQQTILGIGAFGSGLGLGYYMGRPPQNTDTPDTSTDQQS